MKSEAELRRALENIRLRGGPKPKTIDATRYALIHRYGLFGETPKTYREISESLGYKTAERARQLVLGGIAGVSTALDYYGQESVVRLLEYHGGR